MGEVRSHYVLRGRKEAGAGFQEQLLRTKDPNFVVSNSFTNQCLAQLDLWKNRGTNKIGVDRLPKHLDEEVARLHLERIGVKLTKLSKKQAEYLGVPVEGPYKPEHYRY